MQQHEDQFTCVWNLSYQRWIPVWRTLRHTIRGFFSSCRSILYQC